MANDDVNVVIYVERWYENGASFNEYDGEIVLLHNHPNGSRPSYTDILRLQDKNVSSVIAVGHDGSVYEISDYDRGVDIQGL